MAYTYKQPKDHSDILQNQIFNSGNDTDRGDQHYVRYVIKIRALVITKKKVSVTLIGRGLLRVTNSMAYETRRFNAAFTGAPQ